MPTKHAQLPAGWVWVTIGDLLSEPLANGLSIKGSETPPGVPALKLNAMGERGFDWSKVRYLPIDWDEVIDLEIQEGDFFISRGNGSLALVGRGTSAQKPAQRVIFPDTMIRARICEPIRSTGWVQTVWSCPGVREQIERRVKTTAGIWKISQGEIESIRLPLPPLSEQTRIVGEVEEQLTRLDAGVEALKRVQAQLKRYRASVLKAACEGRLVPTEAELARREKRDYEPADKLLARILKERRARWEADQLAKMKAAGKLPKDDKWKAAYPEPVAPNLAGLPQLPQGWTYASADGLSNAFRSITYGVIKLGEPVAGGVPTLRSSNVRQLRLDLEGLKSIAPEIANDYERTFLQGGEIVVTVRGTLGGVVVVPESCSGYNVSREVAVLAPVELRIGPCVAMFIASPQIDGWLKRNAKGIAYTGVNIETLKALPVPLPPLAEQARIVEVAARAMSIGESVEDTLEREMGHASRMRQAVLSQAFEGRLIPQDPRDEPASKLLERISAAVENKPSPKQGRAKQTTTVPKMKATR